MTDHGLVADMTCTYPTTLQATNSLTPIVALPIPFPLGTLHMVLPVDFMLEGKTTDSLPVALKCSTRQQPELYYTLKKGPCDKRPAYC